MKKLLIAAALGALSCAALAQPGGFVSPTAGANNALGGFNGPATGPADVAQAKAMRDDAWVALEGNIVKKVGHELYEFKDASGSINVDIDDKLWLGQTVTPGDKVRIEGEVDKDWNSVEIDVKSIYLAK